MVKGEVTLRDLVSLLSSAGRIRIYEGDDNEVIYSGFKGSLVHEPIIEEKRFVKHIHQSAEFYGRRQNGPFAERKKGAEKLDITEDTAGEFSFADVCLELWTDIYCY